ncbi:MAG: hypothetical protein R3247_06450 [Rhodothermales bacterium]|nr:hypothetical protein [Rhodothermales bacterium]
MRLLPLFLPLLLLTAGCDGLLGSKQDATTDEIFEEGRIPPGLVSDAEYVPLFPFLTVGGDGAPLEAPKDVYVGYDELLYAVDARGLHILDRAGRPAFFRPLDAATNVIQDRRLHVYVTARRDTTIDGRTWNLPVVYRFSGLTAGAPTLEDIIWHPFDDDSRKFTRPDPSDEFQDDAVAFTGVAVLPDNRVYISRRGPVNTVANRSILPQNAVLLFSPEGVNLQALPLSPTRQSLLSAVNPADVLTFVHPPQRARFPAVDDFIVAQAPPEGDRLRFAVLSVRVVETFDGIEYRPDTQKLQAASDPSKGSGFLYEEFKFADPADLAFAADGSNYLFVVDAALDRLFAFTASGIEGVAAPPGARTNLPVNVSFGTTGSGARQFRNPQGVAYFDRTVYVADTGNNRISRFRLNTDFE